MYEFMNCNALVFRLQISEVKIPTEPVRASWKSKYQTKDIHEYGLQLVIWEKVSTVKVSTSMLNMCILI